MSIEIASFEVHEEAMRRITEWLTWFSIRLRGCMTPKTLTQTQRAMYG